MTYCTACQFTKFKLMHHASDNFWSVAMLKQTATLTKSKTYICIMPTLAAFAFKQLDTRLKTCNKPIVTTPNPL